MNLNRGDLESDAKRNMEAHQAPVTNSCHVSNWHVGKGIL